MLNFSHIRSGLVAAIFTSLTLSIGTHPQPPVIGDAPHVPSTVSSEIVDSSHELFEPFPATPDSLKFTATYYSLRRDLRRCASPRCGGYFVKRVNHPLTRCVNGKYMSECYVAEIDWNGNPHVEAHEALLRGNVVTKGYAGFGKFGELRVTESWQSVGEKMPTGVFYRVKDRGVRCITHPCLTHQELQLNSTGHRNIVGVDLNSAGAPDSKVGEAFEAMTQPEGVIVAGSHVPVTGPAGKSYTLKATHFYLHAGKDVGSKTKKSCIKTGCSGQVCADIDVITTCEWRPEYACYQRARCERQADGKCGFTRTPELTACLTRRDE